MESIDMSAGYEKASGWRAQAEIVFDRFHVESSITMSD